VTCCAQAKPSLERLHFAYLRLSLAVTGFLFRSGPAALECKRYFISTLAMFYSAEELISVLTSLGYREVSRKTILAGMIGCHSAAKPA
jgi:demethylmenaquinone methyltransferase/2-methoxy-6-polyprenyl-1,4-benzoquinol methylase